MQTKRYLLYDYLQVAGGAERLSHTLLEHFPDLTLCVAGVYFNFLENINSNVKIIDLSSTLSRRLGVIGVILAFKTRARFLSNADSVLYSGAYAPLAITQQKQGKKLYYCHTLPRFAYDLKQNYLERFPISLRPFFLAFAFYVRYEYERAIKQMDTVIANSHNVQSRLQHYLRVSSQVIYPPIDTDKFQWIEQGDYYLSLARLEPHKRVHLIIEAFKQMPDKKLVVASGGRQMQQMLELAGDANNILFTGWQNDSQLCEWIGKSLATLYLPIDEDFGMSPVEAMAAGKPVIGVAEGGLLETVVAGETGVLLKPDPAVEDIIQAVHGLDKKRAAAMRAACEAQAQRFSRELFLEKMRAILYAW